jgi:ppGpp synthetase/RelA/SpoT-type nucleotidyltranferase
LGIRYQTIEHRVKDAESLIQKVTRPEKQYGDPLSEVTDLAGVRITTYYLDDLDRVGNVIADNFAVSKEDSADRGALLRPNEFGYRSIHYVVSLSSGRSALPEWKPFGSMFVEVQVRTVLQHAWAAMSHALDYKGTHDVPALLSRRLYRLSGLLELADEEFAAIAREARDIAAGAAHAISVGDLRVLIDRDSLSEYLETGDVPLRLTKRARNAGFLRTEHEEVSEFDSVTHLTWAASVAGLRTIEELDRACQSKVAELGVFYDQLIQQSETEWQADTPFFVLLAVLYTFRSRFSVDLLAQHEFGRDIAQHILDVAAVSAG